MRGRGHASRRVAAPLAAALVALALAGAAAAQAAVESDDDRAFLAELRRAFASGGSYSAQQDLEEYLLDFPASAEARALAAEVALDRGRLDEAEEHLRAGGAPEAPASPRLWGALLVRTGRYEDLLAFGERDDQPGVLGALLRVEALDGLGRRGEARRIAREAVEQVDDRGLDGHGLVDLARLLIFLREFELANQALVFADAELNGRRGPNYRLEEPDVLVLLGRVYGATRQSGDGGPDPALAVLNEVLELDDGHADALCVKARVYRYGMQGGKEAEALELALARDPGHPEALVLRGQARLFDRRTDAALEDAEAVLEVDPRHRAALALRAAALEAAGRAEPAAVARARFTQAHPESAALEALLGEVLQQHYRFADSIAPLERALALEPHDEDPLPVLAQSLAHVGREQEARAALEDHRRRSPYDYPWRENMLAVLERLRDRHDLVTDDGFRLRLPVGEQDVLGPLLGERLAEARADMARRWGVEPEREVLVEVFDEHADFSVRTIGFSGLGALGVCFGDVITMLSPLSELRGRYLWPQTAVHEYAHVVTLALSDRRVPRWLTEGVSVWEEKRADPTWGRELEREMLDARANGELPGVERLDQAFRDGATILRGYYQGSLLCEVIVRDFGFAKLKELVAAFAEDRGTAVAIRTALGIEPAELDARLERYFEDVVEPRARIRPRYNEAGKNRLRERVSAGDEAACLELASAYHDLGRRADEDAALHRYLARFGETPQAQRVLAERDVAAGREARARDRLVAWAEAGERGEVQLEADGMKLLGLLQARAGDATAARASLRRAWELFPGDVAPDSAAHQLLALIDPDAEPAAWDELARAICEHDETAMGLRVGLARRAAEEARTAEAVRWLREATAIDPYRPELRSELAAHLEALGEVEQARRQWRLVLGTRAHQLLPDAPSGGPLALLGGASASGAGAGAAELAELHERAREALRRLDGDEQQPEPPAGSDLGASGADAPGQDAAGPEVPGADAPSPDAPGADAVGADAADPDTGADGGAGRGAGAEDEPRDEGRQTDDEHAAPAGGEASAGGGDGAG